MRTVNTAIAMRGAATGAGTVCSSAHRPQLAEVLCGELSDPHDRGRCNRRAAVLAALFALTALQPRPLPANAATPYAAFLGEPRPLSTGTSAAADSPTAFTDEVVASLVYEQVLGQGTFKTVFSVSSPLLEGRWALAVEQMDTQDALREELHGIEVAQELQRTLPRDDRARFEQVSAWWMQKTAVNSFTPGAVVLAPGSQQARFTSQPGGVFKPVFLLALKPIYVTDLEALRKKGLPSKSATFDDQGALRLALDLCKGGRVLHQHGFVHRDIKPKNVMLDAEGSAVLIDFGFSSRAQQVTPA